MNPSPHTTGVATESAPGPAFDELRGKLALWTGVLGAPLLWAAQLQVCYALIRFTCGHRWLALLHHGVTLVTLVGSVACAWLAWRDWQRLGRGVPEGSEGGVAGRSRFMAVLGILTSGLFALLIIAQWVPILFLDPCWS